MLAAELLRKTALDNQTLRALVKRGLVELREGDVSNAIRMATSNSSRREISN